MRAVAKKTQERLEGMTVEDLKKELEIMGNWSPPEQNILLHMMYMDHRYIAKALLYIIKLLEEVSEG